MKINFKINSYWDLLKHLGIIMVITGLFVIIFFFVYLPAHTNHGETITVPDIIGVSMEELDEFLLERNLRYEINDSAYSLDYPPMTVLQQFPKPGAKVKENRKIYISINRLEAPKISMPDLTTGSLKNAEAVLESYELKRGKVLWKPDLAFNRVLEQHYQGDIIEPGTKIPKGAVIDLVVGDGFGKRNFPIDSYVGMPLDEAKVAVNGQGLKLGIISGGNKDSISWVITRQIPEPGENVRIGQTVDFWIAPNDSSKPEQKIELLDERSEPDES